MKDAKEAASSYSSGMSKAAMIGLSFIFHHLVIVMLIFIIAAVIVFSDSGVVFENDVQLKVKKSIHLEKFHVTKIFCSIT